MRDTAHHKAGTRPLWSRCALGLAWVIGAVLTLVITAYVFGAIYFDGFLGGPASSGNLILACAWLAGSIAAILIQKSAARRLGVAVAAIAIVMIPWSLIRPSNDRDWSTDFAQTGWVSENGDEITFHNFRNFDYADDGTPLPKWESRTHHLSKLRGIDYFHDAWGGDNFAHPILSFDFGEEGHVCLSIETRREKHESFSTFGGLFKMFELQYIFGSEEDLIRVRTNVRNEPVYLYRLRATPEHAKEVLRESIAVQNKMKDKPRFYNVLTSNCTTSLRAQTPAEERERFDIRMLINGRLDEYVHEKGAIVDEGLDFETLRPLCLINDVARAKPEAAGYSQRVRANRPGYRMKSTSP